MKIRWNVNKKHGDIGEVTGMVKLRSMGCAVWDVRTGKQEGGEFYANKSEVHGISVADKFRIINGLLEVTSSHFPFQFDFTTLYDMSLSPRPGEGMLEDQNAIQFPIPDFFVSFCPHLVDQFGPFGLVDVKTTGTIEYNEYVINQKSFDNYNMIGHASPIPTFILMVFEDAPNKFLFQSVAILDRYKTKFVVRQNGDKTYKLPRSAFDEL